MQEAHASGPTTNLMRADLQTGFGTLERSVEVFKRAIADHSFDLVIGDQTTEIRRGFRNHPELKTMPFV